MLTLKQNNIKAIQFYIAGKEGGYAVKQNNRLRSKDCVLFKR